MQQDALHEGIQIQCGRAYRGRANGKVRTIQNIEAGYVVNAAGLYADKTPWTTDSHRKSIASCLLRAFTSIPTNHRARFTPIFTLFRISETRSFGVHFTITADGKTKIGPTAIPALWRENYEGFGNVNFRELIEVASRGLGLLTGAGFNFRRLAMERSQNIHGARWCWLARYSPRVWSSVTTEHRVVQESSPATRHHEEKA